MLQFTMDYTKAKKSNELSHDIKSGLIERAQFVHDNAALYLDLNGLSLDGHGQVYLTPYPSNPGPSKRLSFSSDDSIAAALKTPGKTGLLISCSHRRAGGGWLSGSLAQEESVSRATTWAVQAGQKNHKDWYASSTWLGQPGALVINGLVLFDEHGEELKDPKPVVFAGIAAANKAAKDDESYWDSPKGLSERHQALVEHLACAFAGFEERGVENVVLCLFGTNIFGWTVEESIRALAEATKHSQNLHFTCAVCSPEKAAEAQAVYLSLYPEQNPSILKVGHMKTRL